MKIGFVLDDSLDKTDGVQQHILTLGRYFRNAGHEVHYLVGETARSDVDNIHSLTKNLRVQFNRNKMSTPLPASKKKIKQLLEAEKFDILHIQMPYSPLLAGRIIKLAPDHTKIVGTFHIVPYSWIEFWGSRLLAIWCRSSLRKISKIFSVSQPAQQFLFDTFKVASKVIPNPIELAICKTGQPMKELESKSVIVSVGRLVPRKGCAYLLRAMKELKERNILANVHLYVCGTGYLEHELKQYVSDNGLTSYVSFLGYVSEKQKIDYLASADIAVMPSTGGESFGIVLTEAMAAGADVVIAGNNPGYASVLGDRPAQLINPSDTVSFADTLQLFLGSAEERRKAKEWQTNHVRQFDITRVGARILHEYESLLAKPQNN